MRKQVSWLHGSLLIGVHAVLRPLPLCALSGRVLRSAGARPCPRLPIPLRCCPERLKHLRQQLLHLVAPYIHCEYRLTARLTCPGRWTRPRPLLILSRVWPRGIPTPLTRWHLPTRRLTLVCSKPTRGLTMVYSKSLKPRVPRGIPRGRSASRHVCEGGEQVGRHVCEALYVRGELGRRLGIASWRGP